MVPPGRAGAAEEEGKQAAGQAQAGKEVSHPALTKSQPLDLCNTVMVTCNQFGRPYTRKDILAGLQGVVEPQDIVAMGTLQFNHSWFVRVSTNEIKDRMLEAGQILVKSHKATITSCSVRDVTIRAHWLPYGVTELAFETALAVYGEIKSITWEKSTEKGLEHTFTGVVRICVRLKDKITVDHIPHVTDIAGGPSLLLIKNRAPMCLRCKKIGHIRKDCDVPWCRRCNSFGHTAESCTGRSFSSVVGNNSPQANTDEAVDPQMETTEMEVEPEKQKEAETNTDIQEEVNTNSETTHENNKKQEVLPSPKVNPVPTKRRQRSDEDKVPFIEVREKKKAHTHSAPKPPPKLQPKTDTSTSNRYESLQEEHNGNELQISQLKDEPCSSEQQCPEKT